MAECGSFADTCKTCSQKLLDPKCIAKVTSMPSAQNVTNGTALCAALKDATDCFTPRCAAFVRELTPAQNMCALGDGCLAALAKCTNLTNVFNTAKPEDATFCANVNATAACLGSQTACFGQLRGFQAVCNRPSQSCIAQIPQCIANLPACKDKGPCDCYSSSLSDLKKCAPSCAKELDEAAQSPMCKPPRVPAIPPTGTLDPCTLPGQDKQCSGKGTCTGGVFCKCNGDAFFGRWCEQTRAQIEQGARAAPTLPPDPFRTPRASGMHGCH